MIIKQKINYLLIALLFGGISHAQVNPTIYKLNNLLERIHNSSDTIYVINFWATWCKPCVQELPEFEKLTKQTEASKIKVLLVSIDFKENLNDKLIPFLNKNKYTSECVLLDEIDGNYFINEINKKWSGAIPATYMTMKNKSHEIFLERKVTLEELETSLTEFKTK